MTDDLQRLRAMTVPELAACYEEVVGKPPRVKHKGWLWKRIWCRLQEQKLGGLSDVARRRLEELIAEIDLPLDEVHATRGQVRPTRHRVAVGTTLTREWRGGVVRVQVLEHGFEHEGVVYRSLSGVAKAITGSHWNGPLFFGLTARKGAS